MTPKRKRGVPLPDAADALKKACLATIGADAPQVVTEAMIAAADWTLRKKKRFRVDGAKRYDRR